MALNFMAQLPIISETDLVYGNRCIICCEVYGTSIIDSDIMTEEAVRLPCGHEFGSECLSTWLSPQEGKNSCPLCRRELFPTAPEVGRGFVHLHGEREVDWDNVATQTDSELSATGIVHRSRAFGDWLLYAQLRGQGASLPPWRPSSTDPGPRLDSSQEEALFQELQRRGAFLLLPIRVGPLVSDRQVWTFLRDERYSYDPIYGATLSGCAWFRI